MATEAQERELGVVIEPSDKMKSAGKGLIRIPGRIDHVYVVRDVRGVRLHPGAPVSFVSRDGNPLPTALDIRLFVP